MIKFIPVLMYHNIVEQEISNAPDWITASLFEQQLSYLKQKGYTFITPELLLTPQLLQKKSVLITFDDGYKNVYTLAFPILKKLKINFTLFLIADYLSDDTTQKTNSWDENNRPKTEHLSKRMINEMLQTNLLSLGSHSCSHKLFHLSSENDINEEIVLSKHKLENEFKQPIFFFSYPGGYVGDKKITFQELKKNGYKLAFGGQNNRLVNTKKFNYFNISRINITNDINFTNQRAKQRFEVIINPFLNKLSTFNKLNFLINFLLPFFK
jgi:peptidoglycan/xylan/chitin deacetylase (PgdA/CDA1 family)